MDRKEFFPHQIFRMEYGKMLLEAFRQENIHPANAGELAIVQGFFDYIDQVAVPLMVEDEWAFGSVEQFAKEYATDCFDSWERTSTQATKARIEKDAHDERVIDFIARLLSTTKPLMYPQMITSCFFIRPVISIRYYD